ncbi:MAG TPA: polysaccharide deacetylase family protein, partial [Candidatus Eisenbacteria bacterium]|nr:polysaccharide deacetylase family protein [Candidatus Eisenbacteria bacterium]
SKEFATSGEGLSLAGRLAQVAFTATQFPLVQRVVLRLEGRPTWLLGGEVEMTGQPVTRDTYESLLPAIFVESPALADEVASPIHVWGTANVFEARFHAELLAADGTILAAQAVQATSGTGKRGSFDATLAFAASPGGGTLVVYSDAPEDGSRINEVRTPVRLTGGAAAATPTPPEVVLSPTPQQSATAPRAEWQRNLRASYHVFELHRAVALVNMETAKAVAQVGPDTITVDYETSVGGRDYWMTQYSVTRGLPNGMSKSEVAAAVAAPTPPGSTLPASLSGAEWTRLPTTRPVVALTFDSGGNSAGVAPILAALGQQGVPATFFMTGRWTEVYPDLSRQIASRYPVGNHTYSHPHLTTLTDAQVADEISRGEAAIETATGRDPHPLFRFPYGETDARTLDLLHRQGYGGIRWTVDSLGWKGGSAGQSADTVVSRVLANLQPGEIVLMHVGGAEDGTTLDADALPRIIAEVRARGYSFVTVGAFV